MRIHAVGFFSQALFVRKKPKRCEVVENGSVESPRPRKVQLLGEERSEPRHDMHDLGCSEAAWYSS